MAREVERARIGIGSRLEGSSTNSATLPINFSRWPVSWVTLAVRGDCGTGRRICESPRKARWPRQPEEPRLPKRNGQRRNRQCDTSWKELTVVGNAVRSCPGFDDSHVSVEFVAQF